MNKTVAKHLSKELIEILTPKQECSLSHLILQIFHKHNKKLYCTHKDTHKDKCMMYCNEENCGNCEYYKRNENL